MRIVAVRLTADGARHVIADGALVGEAGAKTMCGRSAEKIHGVPTLHSSRASLRFDLPTFGYVCNTCDVALVAALRKRGL